MTSQEQGKAHKIHVSRTWERRRARWNAWKETQRILADAIRTGMQTKWDICDCCGKACQLNTNGTTSVCDSCRKLTD